MRITNSIKWFLRIPFYPGFPLSDRLRILFYYDKSLLNRFLLKKKPTNQLVRLSFYDEPLYFRDNWFDSRSVYTVFSNDYTALDPGVFTNLRTFVDVGANVGFISRCARMASPKCTIICFEPVSKNAELCAKNNPKATVEVCGVGSKGGTAELLVDECGFMASSMKFGYKQAKQKVKIITLDDYFKNWPETIDLIKIDVEGMENEVLKGGKNTIPKAKRLIAEVHSDALLEEFSSIMTGYGFNERRRSSLEKTIYISDWHQ